jgi:hypothetical protein
VRVSRQIRSALSISRGSGRDLNDQTRRQTTNRMVSVRDPSLRVNAKQLPNVKLH